MEYEWDEAKRLANLKKHRVDFYIAYDFEWNTASVRYSERQDEARWTARGYAGKHYIFLVFTIRDNKIRVISIRKAKLEEQDDYAEG